MRLFGDAKTLRGSIAWTNPLRLRVTFFPKAEQPASAAQAPASPRQYTIERDRIFAYLERHKLPSEGQRRIRRDQRNQADFFSDVRELQTHNETDPRA